MLNPPRLRPRAWDACPPFFGVPQPPKDVPDDRTVDDEVFHVGVIDEMLMDTLPYSVVTPAGESLVDACSIYRTLMAASSIVRQTA